VCLSHVCHWHCWHRIEQPDTGETCSRMRLCLSHGRRIMQSDGSGGAQASGHGTLTAGRRLHLGPLGAFTLRDRSQQRDAQPALLRPTSQCLSNRCTRDCLSQSDRMQRSSASFFVHRQEEANLCGTFFCTDRKKRSLCDCCLLSKQSLSSVCSGAIVRLSRDHWACGMNAGAPT